MPIPDKNKNEDKNQFMSRCMSDSTMNKEYPDSGQRTAICMGKACEGLDYIEAGDFAYYFNTYGMTEEITEDNFYAPEDHEYEDWDDGEVTEWDWAAERPGLWENIRKKKEREGKNYKPAKKGDKDRPDPESWKKAQSKEDFKPHKMYDKSGKPHLAKTMEDHLRMKKMGYTYKAEAAFEYENPKTGRIYRYQRKGIYKKDGVLLRFVGKAELELDYTQSAEYQGRKVKLGKPFKTPGGPKKSAVYVKNGSGKVVIVRFGDPNMKIKKSDPGRRKNFRARHNCSNPGPRWKARYWSCKAW
jgi:hypothetical protein